MRGRWKKLVLCVLIMGAINVIPTYASETFYWNGMEIQDNNNESAILPEGVESSTGQARGSIISTGIVSIVDQGKGKASLTVETWAHIPCDRICNALALQKWNKTTEDWEDILFYDFEARQEDNPDEELVILINGVDVENLQPGTYRARGLHAVYLGGEYEGYTSRTNGIQITKY